MATKSRRHDVIYYERSNNNLEVVLTFFVPLLIVGLIIAGICLKIQHSRETVLIGARCPSCNTSSEKRILEDADFVILIRISGSARQEHEGLTTYPVELRNTFKRHWRLLDALRANTIHTTVSSGKRSRNATDCLDEFKMGEEYLVTGKVVTDRFAVLNECDLRIPWSNRSMAQRNELIQTTMPLFGGVDGDRSRH